MKEKIETILRSIYDLMTCELAALRNQKQTRFSNERLEGYEDAIHDLKIIIKDTFDINVGYSKMPKEQEVQVSDTTKMTKEPNDDKQKDLE